MVLRLIKKSDTTFRLYFDYIEDPKDETYIVEIEEPDIAMKKIKRAIAQQHVRNVWCTPTYNVFGTSSFKDACEAIEAFLADKTFVFNEAEYTAALARYEETASNNAKRAQIISGEEQEKRLGRLIIVFVVMTISWV